MYVLNVFVVVISSMFDYSKWVPLCMSMSRNVAVS